MLPFFDSCDLTVPHADLQTPAQCELRERVQPARELLARKAALRGDADESLAMVAAVASLAITMMYSLNEVARELEDPYTAEPGSSENRLQAAALHADFNERLITFYRTGRGRMLGAAAVACSAPPRSQARLTWPPPPHITDLPHHRDSSQRAPLFDLERVRREVIRWLVTVHRV